MTLKISEDLATAVDEASYKRAAAPEVVDAIRKVMAEDFDPEMEIQLKELIVADYVVFLLALDTYMRYLTERFGTVDVTDPIVQSGIKLLRTAERMHLDAIRGFIESNLVTPSSIKLLNRAVSFPPTASGSSRRALMIRTILSRGGTTTTRAVFGSSTKARREVQDAIEASMMEDEDAALNKFSVIVLRNKRLEAWIDKASEAAQPTSTLLSTVEVSTRGTSESVSEILTQRIKNEGASPASQEAGKATADQGDTLARVEAEATAAAAKTMARSQEEDRPLTKSEVMGVATAIVTSIVTDPALPRNIPATLQNLDPEQMAAAMTDGKVLVAAGAGAGKSTTLVARVNHLVRDRSVAPSKIFVTSFNAKAAGELKHKIGKSVGDDKFKQMTVGTMHSLFTSFIKEFGTSEERVAVGRGDKTEPNGFMKGGASIAGAVNRAWVQCFKNDDPPKAKNAMLYKTLWAGNDVSPQQAQAEAQSKEEAKCAIWYEWYEGFKGSIPGWKPPCHSQEWEKWLTNKRPSTNAQPNGIRLGDFDDMLSIFRNILRRNPAVRKKVQGMFDHVLVDECQDLNKTQFEAIQMMTEHIGDGTDGRSLWMVGDDKQSIYGFRGARPEMFTNLHTTEGWKTRVIRTNYRCTPEIVEAANSLIANNDGQIPMQAVPDARKSRGVGSVRVNAPIDGTMAAIESIHEIKMQLTDGSAEVTDFAILTKTNKEQHAYETACIIRGIPYARKGASSFLGSPETKAFLSYVQLATGDDATKMQAALKEVINRPNRFFIGPDAGVQAVDAALGMYSMRTGQDRKTLNPIAALGDIAFQRILAEKLVGQRAGFKFDKAVQKLRELGMALTQMRGNSQDPDYKTTDLFGDILSLPGITGKTDPSTGRTEYVEQTFREALTVDIKNAVSDDTADDELEDEEEDNTGKGLGNVSFLFDLTKVDPTDPGDLGLDPNTPMGFKSKMERYSAKARDLRIDLNKWEKEQEALPAEQRKPAPGVYIGTVHSVKGAQWKNCYVQMPKGKFPFEPKPRPGEDPPDPDKLHKEMQSERRLAYVALTRAAVNLTVVCPSVVDGKSAGISPFVAEANLKVGENVKDEHGNPIKTASYPLHQWLNLEGFEDPKPTVVAEVTPESYSYNRGGV